MSQLCKLSKNLTHTNILTFDVNNHDSPHNWLRIFISKNNIYQLKLSSILKDKPILLKYNFDQYRILIIET